MSDMRLSCRDATNQALQFLRTFKAAGLGWSRHDKTDAYRTCLLKAEKVVQPEKSVQQGVVFRSVTADRPLESVQARE